MLSAGAELGNPNLGLSNAFFEIAENIKNKELGLKLRNTLETNFFKFIDKENTDIQDIIHKAISDDEDLVIKLLLKANKIKPEDLKELYLRAKNSNSKKVGRLLFNALRILEGGLDGGDISTTGIRTWNPSEDTEKTLPSELIEYIATLDR